MPAINPAYVKQPGGANYPAGGVVGYSLIWVGPRQNDVAWSAVTPPYATIGAVFDGASDVLQTGRFVDVPIPYNCTIAEVEMLADPTGSIVIDIWRDSYANFPPTVADSIVAAAPPTISAGSKSKDSTLTGWNKVCVAGDNFRFYINSCALIKKCTIALKVLK